MNLNLFFVLASDKVLFSASSFYRPKVILGQSTLFWTEPKRFEGLGSKSKIQKWKVIVGPVQHYLDLFWSPLLFLAHIYFGPTYTWTLEP